MNIDETIRVEENDMIIVGHCVHMIDDQIVYLGPIKGSPDPTPAVTILLHPDDYARMIAMWVKTLH